MQVSLVWARFHCIPSGVMHILFFSAPSYFRVVHLSAMLCNPFTSHFVSSRSETTVEFASCVHSTCAVSIDVHGLILTDFFAYARTIQETGDGQTKRVVTSTERRNNHSSEPLVNVQESNVPFRALNNIIPSLPLHRPEPTPSANLWPVQFAPEPTPSAIP